MKMSQEQKTAVLFPGQGSQEKDMGRDLAENSTEIMDLWKKAEKISGLPLREIYWDTDEEAMAETRHLQPAMTVVNLSLWIAVRKRLAPFCLAGHSLGEYSALAVAGVLELEDVMSLVSLRGRLMAEADPDGQGAMTAVLKLALPQVEEIALKARQRTGRTIVLANYNTPVQYVLSGDKEAIEAAEILSKEAGGRGRRLAVSGAFHSPLMAEAAAELAGQMDRLRWQRPTMPIYFNVTAATEDNPLEIQKIMARQMTSGVRWMWIVEKQWQDGARHFIELGPKGVLNKMLKSILEGAAQPWSSLSLASKAETREFIWAAADEAK